MSLHPPVPLALQPKGCSFCCQLPQNAARCPVWSVTTASFHPGSLQRRLAAPVRSAGVTGTPVGRHRGSTKTCRPPPVASWCHASSAPVLSVVSLLKHGRRPGRDFQMLICASSEMVLGASVSNPIKTAPSPDKIGEGSW